MSSTAWAVTFFTVLGFFALRTTVLVGGATLAVRRASAVARRVYRVAVATGQARSELLAALRVIGFDAVVVATAFTLGAWRFAEPSAAATAVTWLVMFAWYEVWFYATHRALHTKALYRFHAQHHVAKVTTPLTSLSFGLVERGVLLVGAVGMSALLSRVLPITKVGVVAYFLTNFVLNVWGHSNVEVLPAGFVRSWAGRVFISTSFHAMHHARYQGHYGLFTQVLDRLFGTYWVDYPEVHAHAARGEGLTRLCARVDSAAESRPPAIVSPEEPLRLEEH